jgi:hypothetical protein
MEPAYHTGEPGGDAEQRGWHRAEGHVLEFDQTSPDMLGYARHREDIRGMTTNKMMLCGWIAVASCRAPSL